MKEFDKLFESVLQEFRHGKKPSAHDPKKDSGKKVYSGKDYRVTLTKGKSYTKKGIHQAVYKDNPSLSKDRAKQVASQIHRSVTEAKEAPRGKHYKKGSDRLYKNGHASDGNPEGGPRLNSDPTYKNPNESKVAERTEYPQKAPKGKSFVKSGPRKGQRSNVPAARSDSDNYVRMNPNHYTAGGFSEKTMPEKQKVDKKKKKNPRARVFDPVSGTYYVPRKMPESYVQEDGHSDIASVNKQLHTGIKALKTIKDEIDRLSCSTDLPTWWTNKVAIAIDKLDGMADYLDAKVPESVDQLQEKKADRCKRKADSVYGKKTSAYKSGAIVRCRQGKIWKKK
tara:strand:- start:600 stop:1613 length:1014 start_codon:yes stop_codon:yes gene_type:complete